MLSTGVLTGKAWYLTYPHLTYLKNSSRLWRNIPERLSSRKKPHKPSDSHNLYSRRLPIYVFATHRDCSLLFMSIMAFPGHSFTSCFVKCFLLRQRFYQRPVLFPPQLAYPVQETSLPKSFRKIDVVLHLSRACVPPVQTMFIINTLSTGLVLRVQLCKYILQKDKVYLQRINFYKKLS